MLSKVKIGILILFLAIIVLIYNQPVRAQVPCPTSTQPNFDGLVTAVGTITDLTSSGKCITGDQAAILLEQARYKVESYESLLITFFDQAKLPADGSIQKIETSVGNHEIGDLTFNDNSADYLYKVNGDLIVEENDNIPDAVTAVFFIEGDLEIKNNINHNASGAGLVFIVRDDIKIDPAVTALDAVLISSREICTAFNFTTNNCPSFEIDSKQLVVNGALISLNSQYPIQFIRSLEDNRVNAAEKIVYQPKYAAILKGLLSKDLLILKEE